MRKGGVDAAARRKPPCFCEGKDLNPCARELWRREVEGSFHLDGEWKGWRIQGNALIGPGGVRWTPQTLTQARAWQEFGTAGLAETRDVLERARGAGATPLR